MPYKLDASGNWIYEPDNSGGSSSGGSGSGSYGGDKQVAKGNPSATDSAIKETNANKTDDIKYVETASFKILGDTNIRKGANLEVGSGIGERWQGKWLILSTTHTIDGKGYNVDGTVGREPYIDTSSSGSGNTSGSSGSGNTTSSATDSSKNATKDTAASTATTDKTWKLMPDGTWVQVEK